MAAKGTPRRYQAVRYVSQAEEMNARCRPTMEDAHIFVDSFNGDASSALFGVFDGHGGREIVEFVSKNFERVLAEELRKTSDVGAAITSAFQVVDAMSSEIEHNSSGCTGAVCLLRKVGRDRVLFSANVGDSRAVLSRDGKALRLSEDHKATSDSERARIEEAGGFVLRGRVVGVLAVTRSFGDHSLKQFVTARPHVEEVKVLPSDKFIVIACDGLFDVFEDQEVVDFISERMAAGRESGSAQALIQQALARGSMDNVSVVVVYL